MSTMAGLMLAEKMGSMFFTATTVTCFMVCSELFDRFGWVGIEVHRVNPWRLVGCALLLGRPIPGIQVLEPLVGN
jgi:transporter family-2 protein